jgi:hypothetical protein
MAFSLTINLVRYLSQRSDRRRIGEIVSRTAQPVSRRRFLGGCLRFQPNSLTIKLVYVVFLFCIHKAIFSMGLEGWRCFGTPKLLDWLTDRYWGLYGRLHDLGYFVSLLFRGQWGRIWPDVFGFFEVSRIARGRFGEVDKVFCGGSYYARKKISRDCTVELDF